MPTTTRKSRLTPKLRQEIERHIKPYHSCFWEETFVKCSPAQRSRMDWYLIRLAVHAMKNYENTRLYINNRKREKEQAMYLCDRFLIEEVEPLKSPN